MRTLLALALALALCLPMLRAEAGHPAGAAAAVQTALRAAQGAHSAHG